MSLLLSFKTTFDTLSFYLSWRLSHDAALKPNNTNRNTNIKPKLKANAYNYDVLSYSDPKYNGRVFSSL